MAALNRGLNKGKGLAALIDTETPQEKNGISPERILTRTHFRNLRNPLSSTEFFPRFLSLTEASIMKSLPVKEDGERRQLPNSKKYPLL